MATNSLHLTTMCLQYRPTFVACVCIHLACKWSSWEIPKSSEGKEWFWYVDKSVTSELLEELTSEFLAILDKCPSKLKRKMSLAKELLPEEKKTKVGTSQPSSKEVIKQNHVNSQQSSKSHQLRLPSPKKQIKKSPGQPSVNGKENADHSFHLQVTSVPTLSSSPSENISPSKKIKPEGSVTISLAAYREMKEKRDKERQSQQDDVRKQVGASGSEERKAGKPQAHNVHKKGSQNIRSSEGTSESLGAENSERKKSEIVSALLNELSDDEQNSQQSNDFIRKPESLPHPRMPKDPSQSFTAVSTKHQDVLELPRPQTVNSDDLVKSFNENSKESSTKLVIKSNRDQKHPPSLVQKSTENSYRISGSNKSSRTNKHAKIKISKKPHQHSVSEVSQAKTLNSNRKRKSPHLETLPQASVSTNAVSRQSENGANSDGCKSAKISTSGDLTVNPKHKHKHAEKEKSSKSVLEHQNTSIPSPSLKMKIPKEKIKINQHNPDSSSKSSTQHREDLKIKINQHNPDSSSKSNTQHREDLKIKINQHNPDSSSKSTLQHREDLKIKIPKLKLGVAESSKSSVIPPESGASSGSSLKLVISKERINSGTYSKSSSKPEKESRKRERSPKDSTLNKSPKQSKLECHATSSQKAGQSQEANSVSNIHPLGKQGYNQNTSGHPGVSHGHHRTDGMGGMFQGKRMAQPRPPPPPQYMMNYGTPQGFPYPQYYPYTLHVPIPMANYHHQAFPQLFGNPPPPPPPQDPPLPREPPPPSPPPPPPPE